MKNNTVILISILFSVHLFCWLILVLLLDSENTTKNPIQNDVCADMYKEYGDVAKWCVDEGMFNG